MIVSFYVQQQIVRGNIWFYVWLVTSIFVLQAAHEISLACDQLVFLNTMLKSKDEITKSS